MFLTFIFSSVFITFLRHNPVQKNLVILMSFFYIIVIVYTTVAFIESKSIFLCRYDHLSRVLTKVLDERPNNVVDIFEDVSKDSKRSKFTSDVDTVRDKLDQSTEVALAKVQEKLFAVCISNQNVIDITKLILHP